MRRRVKTLLSLDSDSSASLAGRAGRAGVASSAVFLVIVASLMAWVSNLTLIPSLLLATLGLYLFISSLDKKLTRSRANLVALLGHMCALFSFYIFYTRIVNVSYVTDSIVGTYMGVVKVISLQNPYASTIKPLLDQLGFPPSFYTPRIDGSFEFHLNYPAMNFLSLIPAYLAGLHDLRDGVFAFHVASILLVFCLVPSRWKALSLAPFALGFPLAIGYSWTDSIWAFFIILTAVLWKRDKRLSLLSFGLAVATKQIALVAAPFLLIRLWKESSKPKSWAVLKGVMISLAGFVIPNIPFIIASPSAWWTATVVPYLPSRTGLVPGGIGLSEILPDSGLVLSPIVFTVLTALATAVCIGFFVVRYNRMNRFLWAMPVIILFFYPRSLPNYIVFWSFPYLFEWFKYGNPGSTLFRIRLLTSSAFKAAGQNMLVVLRKRVSPFVILAVILTATVMGASGAYVAQASRPRLDVKVDGIADPDGLGVATSLTVSVINYGSQPVSPRFFVKWFFLWDYWKPNSTDPIPAGATARYELTATDALGAVRRGSSFRVAVYDSVSGESLGLSSSYVSNVSRPRIANPSFKWWTLDLGTGRQAPFPWKPFFTNVGQGEGGISIADTSSDSGSKLWLNSTSDESIAELGLSQQLQFNQTNLTAMVYVSPTASSSNAVFGVSVTDHVHLLYYVLSPAASARSISDFGSNTTITLPIQNGTWQTVFFDIRNSWQSEGWNPPSSLDVSLFLRSSQPGQFSVSIQQVTS